MHWNGTSDVAKAGAAGGDWNAPLVGETKHRGDVGGRFREDHHIRKIVGGPLVGRVDDEGFRGSGDLAGTEQGGQRN